MVEPKNPALHEEPLSQRAPIIPLNRENSILAWLEDTGRMLAPESTPSYYGYEEETSEELNDYIGEADTYDLDEAGHFEDDL